MEHIPVFGRENFFLDPECGIACNISRISTLPGLHTHDFFELFVVVDGKALHMVDKSVELVERGDLFLIRPHDVHCYNFYNSSDFLLYNLAFSNEICSDICLFLGQEEKIRNLCESSHPPRRHLGYLEIEYITSCIKEIGTCIGSGKKEEARGLARTLIAQTLQHCFLVEGTAMDTDVPEWLCTLISLMKRQENFKQEYSRMCELAPCSPNHLCRCFREYCSEKPTDFINRERLKYSMFLLHQSNMSIIDVCQECGFSNLSHFYHLFKSNFGITPVKARKQKSGQIAEKSLSKRKTGTL